MVHKLFLSIALAGSTILASITTLGLPFAASAQVRIGPVDLVSLAFQGFLEDEGIPRAGALKREVRFNQIQAEDLVSAGIEAGRLSPSLLQDQGYLRAVQTELDDLDDRDFDDN